VKYFSWNVERNHQLIVERGISFEDVVFHIEKGELVDIVLPQNQHKYPNHGFLS